MGRAASVLALYRDDFNHAESNLQDFSCRAIH
jgi:hypothetical protein